MARRSSYLAVGPDSDRAITHATEPGVLRRAHRRWHAEEGDRRGPGSAVQPGRHAHLPARPSCRPDRAAQRDARGRRRDRPRAVGERDPDRAVARQQVGGVHRALQDVGDATARHRAPRDDRARQHGLPGGAGLARRGLLAALVRRQPARPLDARPGTLHARPGDDVRVRRGRAAGTGRAGERGHRHRVHRGERCPGGRGRPRRRAHHHDGRQRTPGRDRARRPRRPRQPHRRGRSRRDASRFRRARSGSTRQARRSCPASSTRTRISADLAMA